MEMLILEDVIIRAGGEHPLNSLEDYVFALQKFRKTNNLLYSNRLYGHLCHNGLETHKDLGNYLIPMLVQCGSFPQALQLFSKLDNQNEFSWSSLVQGCIEVENPEFAFDLFQDMQRYDIQPSKFTFIALLKACAATVSIEKGWKIHSEVAHEALERDPFVAGALMDMYTSCDLPSEAENVFEDVPVRDVVLWNSLIVSYADSGSTKDILKCLEQMQVEGVSPDAVTYLCCLKTCKSLDNVHVLYTEIVIEGYDKQNFIGNTLVGLYAKYSLVSVAWEVFAELTARDVISWNLLIAGCLEQGLDMDALKYLEQMQQEDVSPDNVSFIHGLKACISLRALENSLALHTEIVIQGFEKDSFLANTLIDMYGKLGGLSEAKDTLYEMPNQSVVSWTALIGGLTEHGQSEEALSLLEAMQSEGIPPNSSTFICCLKACGNACDMDMGLQVHREIVKKGLNVDGFVGNALVDMYARCRSLAESQSVFSALLNQDVVSWTSLITAYAEHNCAEEAVNSLKCMQLEGVFPDVVSWNAVIYCYGEHGETEKSLELYAQMLEQGLLPSISTFAGILHGCSSETALKHGRRIHSQILRSDKVELIEVSLATALVDMYSKCGSMVEAEQVFDFMPTRSIVAWNALIASYVRKGDSVLAFQLFDRLIEEGIKPDETAFLSVLTLCNHVGLVRKGLDYFETMIHKYNIVPTSKHYNSLLDLLGRAGQLNEAVIMFAKMPSQPDLATWNTLLGACQKWGDIELGRQAFELSKGLDETIGAGFILMSNLYVDAAA